MWKKFKLRCKAGAERAQAWWRSLTFGQASSVAGGVGITAGLLAAGGVAAQGCLMALVVNMFLWRLFHDSEWMWQKIEKYRLWADGLVTLLGFFFSPVPGAAGAFFSIMLGVYFSITRGVVLPPDADAEPVKVPSSIKKYKVVTA